MMRTKVRTLRLGWGRFGLRLNADHLVNACLADALKRVEWLKEDSFKVEWITYAGAWGEETTCEWRGSAERRGNQSLFPLLVGAIRFQREIKALSDLLGCDGDDRIKREVRAMLVEMYAVV